ncbi:MAG: hypothetical protein ACREJM_12240 [Candidatus Saccharimonadales bacterium]
MKIIRIGLVLAMCIGGLQAEDLVVRSTEPYSSKRIWIRRVTLAASCAASLVFDTISTQRAVAAGGVESNGLLANSEGRPDWGRMIGMKAGLCGASLFMQESRTFGQWRGSKSDWTWTGINLGTASVYTWAGLHNLKIASQLLAPPNAK